MTRYIVKATSLRTGAVAYEYGGGPSAHVSDAKRFATRELAQAAADEWRAHMTTGRWTFEIVEDLVNR